VESKPNIANKVLVSIKLTAARMGTRTRTSVEWLVVCVEGGQGEGERRFKQEIAMLDGS
jgi:hypothetical protein